MNKTTLYSLLHLLWCHLGGDSISGQDTAFDASLNGATQSTATLPSTQVIAHTEVSLSSTSC